MQLVTGSAERYIGKGRIFWQLKERDIWSGFISSRMPSLNGKVKGRVRLTDDTTYSGFDEVYEFIPCVPGFD